ncbi:hypothetical protein MMC30_005650 [Trapelia coarctata]|nr:hypothetical protein [Trapelia coarctata]
MVSRKRGAAEMESSGPSQENSLLTRLRNMWEFANIMQYIYIFGKAVKVDEDFDIEDLETECLKPGPSDKLAEIGLCLLKFVSSHRGLTPEIFDEYTRRQYVAKAPSRNPFGTEEAPEKFADFDVFTRLRILFQLSQWTLLNPDRMRERMPESKDTEQTQWRIEEIGYDKQERLYFVLDDNRLYRRTDPALPPPPASKPKSKPKPKSKAGKAAARAGKRRKTAESETAVNDEDEAGDEEAETKEVTKDKEDDGLGGRKWECIAVTLAEYKAFLATIQKSRDADEKVLYSRLTNDVLPIIEKMEEDRQKKIARRQKELMNLEKLATAKRSSRIASKQDREREEREAREAEAKRHADLIAARKDAERQKHMDEARESRMMTREQRLKEREYKRLLAEEELANLSEDSKKLETGQARMSERHLKAEMEKTKKELDKLAQEDEWVFDCSVCGVHGENLDDGSHSIACEDCNVWQHSSCLGVSQEEAEKDDFHFICRDCQRKKEDAKKPKIAPLKFKLGSSSSPPAADKTSDTIHVNGDHALKKRKSDGSQDGPSTLPPMKKFKPYYAPAPSNGVSSSNGYQPGNFNGMHQSIMNGPTLAPQGQMATPHGANGAHQPPPGLASSTHTSTYVNGYYQHPQANQKVHLSQPRHPQSLPDPFQGAPGSNSAFLNGYGAHHTPYGTQANNHQTNHTHSSQNPFYNSFHSQRPVSSHSTQGMPSPVKNRPSMSPTQGNMNVGSPAYPPPSGSPNANGLSPYRSGATHPLGYAGQTPSHNTTPVRSFGPSSSPIIPPPSTHSQGSSAGISPLKHSPPRPASSYGVSGTPVMPPAAHLFPSPQVQQNLHAPVKGMNPEQTKVANGEADR